MARPSSQYRLGPVLLANRAERRACAVRASGFQSTGGASEASELSSHSVVWSNLKFSITVHIFLSKGCFRTSQNVPTEDGFKSSAAASSA